MIYIFALLTLLILIALLSNFNTATMFVASIFLTLLISLLRFHFKRKNEIEKVNDFTILVSDCTIYKIELSESVGCYNVKIQDKNGNKLNFLATVRQENVEIGTKCLLVWKKHPYNAKKDRFAVFTDFMLSDEGLKLRNYGSHFS